MKHERPIARKRGKEALPPGIITLEQANSIIVDYWVEAMNRDPSMRDRKAPYAWWQKEFYKWLYRIFPPRHGQGR